MRTMYRSIASLSARRVSALRAILVTRARDQLFRWADRCVTAPTVEALLRDG
jgi:hypothetical protein